MNGQTTLRGVTGCAKL